MNRFLCLLFMVTVAWALPRVGMADAPHMLPPLTLTDTAAGAVYNDGWQNGDDDNPAANTFGAWQLVASGNSSQSGFFVGNSNSNGNTTGVIGVNTSGRAWGMYANSGNTATATRAFPFPLSDGDIVSIRMDNGFIDNLSETRVELLNSTGTVLTNFRFQGGDSAYEFADLATSGTGISFSDEGLSVSFRIGALGVYTPTVTRLDGGGSYQAARSLALATNRQVQQIRLVNNNSGGGSQRDLYFNSLSVTYNSLAVSLNTFEAQAHTDGVLVGWETLSEVDTLGFNLYRATTLDGELTQLNTALIPAQATGGGGAMYEFLDRDVSTGTSYYYYLDAIATDGNATRYGPATIDITPTAVTVGGFEAEGNGIPLWVWAGVGIVVAGFVVVRRR